MVKKRTVAIFTGNRAEYGLQFPIIREISKNNNLSYHLIVSGSHLEKKFGETIKQIKLDKLKIGSLIKLTDNQSKNVDYTSNRISESIYKISKVLKKIKPNFMLINADRYETFAAAIASSQMNIPTCHIEGGDITQGGALDDSIRHAITKLSHLHFCTNQKSFKNILKLGEEKWRVFNVGLSINDIVSKKNIGTKDYLEKKYNINFNKPIIIFTQHSLTTEPENSSRHIQITLKSLKKLINNQECQVIATYPNNDSGHQPILSHLKKFKKNNINFFLFKSLGNYDLHSFMFHSQNNRIFIMGNSSSGIKEAIFFKCPVVNIGNRQNGRLKPSNVLDAKNCEIDIMKKSLTALYCKKFRARITNCRNPYFKKNPEKKISNILTKIKLNKNLIQKKITY